jgi:hypothetical protein
MHTGHVLNSLLLILRRSMTLAMLMASGGGPLMRGLLRHKDRRGNKSYTWSGQPSKRVCATTHQVRPHEFARQGFSA